MITFFDVSKASVTDFRSSSSWISLWVFTVLVVLLSGDPRDVPALETLDRVVMDFCA